MRFKLITLLLLTLFTQCKAEKKVNPIKSKGHSYVVGKSKESLFFPLPLSSKLLNSESPLALDKNIEGILEYTCGEKLFECFPIKSKWSFDIYIMNSSCYDFEYKDLVLVKDNKVLSRILIEEHSWNIESDNLTNERIVSFNIDENYNLHVKMEYIQDEKVVRADEKTYKIYDDDKFD